MKKLTKMDKARILAKKLGIETSCPPGRIVKALNAKGYIYIRASNSWSRSKA